MSPGTLALETYTTSFPRVSGDEPAIIEVVADEAGFSPRERG